MPKIKNQTVNISLASFLKIIGLILGVVFIYFIRDILVIIFIAIIIGAAIEPWVDYLQNKKIPRPASILTLYILGLGVFSVALVLIIPVMATELASLANNFPTYYEKVLDAIGHFQSNSIAAKGLTGVVDSWTASIGESTKGIFSTLSGIFGGLISLIAILMVAFYLIVEKNNMKNFLQTIVPVRYHAYAIQLYSRVQKKIGAWLTGQLFLMLIIAALSYIGLLIVGVRYTLILALIAGLFEIIPYIGPTLGAIPAVLIALSDSPLKALFVIILYLVIQQLENSVIVPRVMKKAVGLNPIVVILVILIGGKIAGIVGALLAVPIATIASVLVKDYFEIIKSEET